VITNNIIRHVNNAINFLGKDANPSQEAKRIRIENNLFVDVESTDSAYFLQMCLGDTVTVDHNTVQQTGVIIICSCESAPKNFAFRNNIVQYNLYGVYCDPTATPGGVGSKFKGNIIADNRGAWERAYPPPIASGNLSVPNYDALGFTDYRRGDWSLSPKSKARGRATDGRDPGVDFEALRKAVAPTDVTAPYFGAVRQ
jgi:hypothetical protein